MTSHRLLDTLTIAAAVGSGISGGVFFAFSTFVMPALDRLPPVQSIAAMQSINLKAPNPLFMGALFGTAALSVGLGVVGLVRRGEPGSSLMVAGAATYLVCVVVTAAFHVPRNDALAALDPTHVDAAREWARFSPSWTAGNHIRTLSGVGGALLFALAARASAAG